MRYLLDTNAVVALLNNKSTGLAVRAKRHKPMDIGISAIVLHELFYGAFKSRRQEHNVDLLETLPFEIVSFDKEDAQEAGRIRALLSAKGTPIGSYDYLIAGQAKARKLILVTHNTKEFSRVSGLRIEDWE